MTESMIKLRRRFDYKNRSRPNAIAIVDPSSGSVLFPGKEKVEAAADNVEETKEASENDQMQRSSQHGHSDRTFDRKFSIRIQSFSRLGNSSIFEFQRITCSQVMDFIHLMSSTRPVTCLIKGINRLLTTICHSTMPVITLRSLMKNKQILITQASLAI